MRALRTIPLRQAPSLHRKSRAAKQEGQSASLPLLKGNETGKKQRMANFKDDQIELQYLRPEIVAQEATALRRYAKDRTQQYRIVL